MMTDPAVCHGDTLVDKLLGAAYGNVKKVADNLMKVLYVADNMESIHTAAQQLTLAAVLPTDAMPPSLVVDLPAGMDVGTVRGTRVAVHFSVGGGVACFDAFVGFGATTATVFLANLSDSALGGTLYLTIFLGSEE